jgi:hypothetical protein
LPDTTRDHFVLLTQISRAEESEQYMGRDLVSPSPLETTGGFPCRTSLRRARGNSFIIGWIRITTRGRQWEHIGSAVNGGYVLRDIYAIATHFLNFQFQFSVALSGVITESPRIISPLVGSVLGPPHHTQVSNLLLEVQRPAVQPSPRPLKSPGLFLFAHFRLSNRYG